MQLLIEHCKIYLFIEVKSSCADKHTISQYPQFSSTKYSRGPHLTISCLDCLNELTLCTLSAKKKPKPHFHFFCFILVASVPHRTLKELWPHNTHDSWRKASCLDTNEKCGKVHNTPSKGASVNYLQASTTASSKTMRKYRI